MKAMPYCGEKYHNLIRTNLGGTPEEPLTYGAKLTGLPEPIDWWHWKTLADELYTKASDAMTKVGDVEVKNGRGFPEWNAIVGPWQELERLKGDLGSFATTSPARGIPDAVKVCEQAACVLQLCDEALERLGESPTVIKVPPSKSKLSDWILPAAFVAGVGYLIVREWRSSSSSSSSEAA